MANVGERRQGSCKWFNATKGYGFITDKNKEELFVHHTAIRSSGFRTLCEGEPVEFEVEIDASNRKKAVNVSGIEGAPLRGDRPNWKDGGGYGRGMDGGGYQGGGGGGYNNSNGGYNGGGNYRQQRFSGGNGGGGGGYDRNDERYESYPNGRSGGARYGSSYEHDDRSSERSARGYRQPYGGDRY